MVVVKSVKRRSAAGDGSADRHNHRRSPQATAKVYVFPTVGIPGQSPISGAPTGASIKNDLNVLASGEVEFRTVSFLGKPVGTAPDDDGRPK